MATNHMLWAHCRRDAKTDRRPAGLYVGGDLIAQLVVHCLLLAEKPSQAFGKTAGQKNLAQNSYANSLRSVRRLGQAQPCLRH